MSADSQSTPPTPAAGPPPGARSQWLQWLVIFAVFFIEAGAPAPAINETHYLAKAKHYWDPTFCSGDLFLNSADPHLVFYWTVGWLTKWLSLPATAWVGRIAAWALLAAAWQRLWNATCRVHTMHRRGELPAEGTLGAYHGPYQLLGAVLSAALFVTLIDQCNFAGEWVVGGVEAKCFAYALVLCGLTDMVRGRWTTPWVWFGAAASFHVLVGGWAVLAGLFAWAMLPRPDRSRWTSLLPGLAAGGLLSLAGLLPALALERGVDPAVSDEAARIYVFERLPHHLSPWSLPSDELRGHALRFGLLVGVLAVAWAWFRRRDRGYGALSPLMWFAVAALAADIAGSLIEFTLCNSPLVAARWLRYYWFRQADVAVPLAAALALSRLSIEGLAGDRRCLRALACAPALWCGWHLTTIVASRLQDPTPAAFARMDDPGAWQAACAWVRDYTPATAVFIIPRNAQSFKWFAHRADVANWKDLPQDATSVLAWHDRINALFPTIEYEGLPWIVGSAAQLGTARVRELAARYGATHIIAPWDQSLDLHRAYPTEGQPNDTYAVYEIGPPPKRAAP